MKYCVNCKHSRDRQEFDGMSSYCEAGHTKTEDPVRGLVSSSRLCTSERKGDSIDTPDFKRCGPQAIFFEEKPKPLPVWRHPFNLTLIIAFILLVLFTIGTFVV